SLAEAKILERSPQAASQTRFSFRHALIREAAWESMLPARRRSVHGTLAAVLQRQAEKGGTPAEPAHLAWHFEQARDFGPAVDARSVAAQAAARASAYGEARQHLERGLALVAELPDSEQRSSRELDLNIALGAVLTATHGFSA